MPTPYEATFSVPLTCDSCIKDISSALNALPGMNTNARLITQAKLIAPKCTSGIQDTSFSLGLQIVRIKGSEPPSKIIKVIEETGRNAILRGSGEKGVSAVSILELPPSTVSNTTSTVRGLARFIQLTPKLSLLDFSLSHLPFGRYSATIRECGDISRGAASMGGVFRNTTSGAPLAVNLDIDSEGNGRFVGEVEWSVGEIIGRGMLVAPGEGEEGLVVGVVARSAGVWENERKVVCSCSGMTVWEERNAMRRMGVL